MGEKKQTPYKERIMRLTVYLRILSVMTRNLRKKSRNGILQDENRYMNFSIRSTHE